MNKDSKIWVAGHTGLVGSAILRKLEAEGYTNIVTTRRSKSDERGSPHADLRVWKDVWSFAEHNDDIRYIFLCAATVGGIVANDRYPAEFIMNNLWIQTNIVNVANCLRAKLLFLGSSCIYPKLCPQPIKEEYLMTGALEPTNSAYAVAKIAGIEMCKAFWKQHKLNSVIVMPTNLYGPNDNYDRINSHVLPAMISKIHYAWYNEQPTVTLWGDGSPYREFMHVDDLADASVYLMNNHDYNPERPIINVGTGKDITIKGLAEMVAKIVGYKGTIIWDSSKPNGTPRKLLDVSYLKELGWESSIELENGVRQVYEQYKMTKCTTT